ncbi:hypothetical protein SOVF_100030 [Spinacia oleracea]|uniref:Uncharacterized protein isoform X2 n=1 Tax=Spinacia oleracea TaxID=3562 RepID=A0ABM3QS02_SPIOL|nr:uncharacterized protein LOC110804251 isoform X2 [Spinacia oleracea]XP_056686124.1 uncharacterized protein LOC110804251 isoform X2 [Spinacia oleracea]XP_056686125.1 uncharacterized protein LOC110804251 isoform X2 [Spinacia oleracea]KNA15237.1 hypothetical protein SOVF_100030 [Spinacia oleracea]
MEWFPLSGEEFDNTIHEAKKEVNVHGLHWVYGIDPRSVGAADQIKRAIIHYGGVLGEMPMTSEFDVSGIETFVGGGEAERVDLSRGNVGKKRKGSMSTDDDFRGHGHAVVLVGWEPGNKFVYLNSRSADWGVEANLKDRKPKKRGRERKSIASTCTKLKEASKGFSTVTAEGLHFVYCPQLLKWW